MYKYHCSNPNCGEVISDTPCYRCPCCGGTLTRPKPRLTKRQERKMKKVQDGAIGGGGR